MEIKLLGAQHTTENERKMALKASSEDQMPVAYFTWLVASFTLSLVAGF